MNSRNSYVLMCLAMSACNATLKSNCVAPSGSTEVFSFNAAKQSFEIAFSDQFPDRSTQGVYVDAFTAVEIFSIAVDGKLIVPRQANLPYAFNTAVSQIQSDSICYILEATKDKSAETSSYLLFSISYKDGKPYIGNDFHIPLSGSARTIELMYRVVYPHRKFGALNTTTLHLVKLGV